MTIDTVSTRLEYILSPTKVTTGQPVSLMLSILNPPASPALSFQGGRSGSQILVTIPAPPAVSSAAALTDVVDFPAESGDVFYNAGIQNLGSNTFVIAAPTGQTLAPGSSFTVVFPNVVISTEAGPSSFTIAEYLSGPTPGAAITIPLSKIAPTA